MSARLDYDLFLISHRAPEQTRLEMMYWIRAQYPKAKILTLNPPQHEQLDELRYNAPYDAPDIWLPMIEAAVNS